MKKILFVCAENAGRSQMAEAFFNFYAKKVDIDWTAESCGTFPASQVNSLVAGAMKEKNIDLSWTKPKKFLPERITDYERVISFGCLVKAAFLKQVQEKIEDWYIEDPREKTIEEVRKIRNEVEEKVSDLVNQIAALQWSRWDKKSKL